MTLTVGTYSITSNLHSELTAAKLFNDPALTGTVSVELSPRWKLLGLALTDETLPALPGPTVICNRLCSPFSRSKLLVEYVRLEFCEVMSMGSWGVEAGGRKVKFTLVKLRGELGSFCKELGFSQGWVGVRSTLAVHLGFVGL